MENETKNKISKKAKIVIAILLALIVINISALAGHFVYLNYFVNKSGTVVVPDNLIGEEEMLPDDSIGGEETSPDDSIGGETVSPDASNENESSGQQTESGDSDEMVSVPENENSSGSGSSTDMTNNIGSNVSGMQNKATTIILHKSQLSDNEKFTVKNMLPGDVETKYFAVKVSHNADVMVYFRAEVTEQTKRLADVLYIKVTHLDNNKVLYDGAFAEVNSEGYGEIFAADQSTETVAYYKVEVSLPTSTGNEYQAAKLMADFDWFVKITGSMDSPQTGDNSNIALWVILMCSSFAVVFILLFDKCRKKEREAA